MHLAPTLIRDVLDLEKLRTFLQQNNLPYSDISTDSSLYLVYYDEAGNIIGSGGLELYGTSALLRSIAVSQDHRGKNLGKQIVDALLERAACLKIRSVFLLTETAHDFFLKKGFFDVSREDIPPDIKSSTQFTSVCPVSAASMACKIKI